jgi:hypothetical protein
MSKALLKTLILSAVALTAVPAFAFDFQPSLQADVRAGDVNMKNPPSNDFAWNGQVVFAPAMQLNDRNSLLPVFAYLVQSSDAVVEEDSFFVEDHLFLAKPELIHVLNSDWNLKAWGDARRAVTMESYQAPWSTGVYDYEQFGGGAGATWKTDSPRLASVDLGLEVLHRGYPNWHEIAGTALSPTGAVVGGQNYYDKDYVGYQLTVGLNGQRNGQWTWTANLTYLDRDYTDALVETANGYQVGDSLRRDHFGDLDAHLSRTMAYFLLDLTGELTGNLSNANGLDAGAAQYIPGFYDYLSEEAGLALTYAPRGGNGPSITASASLLNRYYSGPNDSGRQILNPNGKYALGKEDDVEQRYHLDGRWPILWHLAVVANVDYTIARSNEYQLNGYRPGYDLIQAMAGLQYKL